MTPTPDRPTIRGFDGTPTTPTPLPSDIPFSVTPTPDQLELAILRCRKPHLMEGPYRDRQRIEDWNDGVESLGREVRKAAQPAPALDADLTVVREHLRKRITELSRSGGAHRYGRGGIHMDVSDCGECGRLHAFTAALQWLEPLGDPA